MSLSENSNDDITSSLYNAPEQVGMHFRHFGVIENGLKMQDA